ncbi:MAG: hypothetical protein ACR2FY_05540 [Pirellulaceae bacterium]
MPLPDSSFQQSFPLAWVFSAVQNARKLRVFYFVTTYQLIDYTKGRLPRARGAGKKVRNSLEVASRVVSSELLVLMGTQRRPKPALRASGVPIVHANGRHTASKAVPQRTFKPIWVSVVS